MSNGQLADITSSATWLSSDPNVASVDANGVVTVMALDTATITASKDGVTSGGVKISVPAPTVTGLSVGATHDGEGRPHAGSGGNRDLPEQRDGGCLRFRGLDLVGSARGHGRERLGRQRGTVTAIASGTVEIAAALARASPEIITLTVPAPVLQSIEAHIDNTSLPVGLTKQLTVTGTYDNGATQSLTSGLTWTAVNPTRATVSETGVVTGISAGAAAIDVDAGSGVTTTLSITVVAPIVTSLSMSPATVSIPKGDTQQLLVMGTLSDGSASDVTSSVTYSFGTPGVAAVFLPPVSSSTVRRAPRR